MDKKRINNENRQRYYEKVRAIAKKEYCGSWKEVWANYVDPIYPMTYYTFLRIIHGGNNSDKNGNE